MSDNLLSLVQTAMGGDFAKLSGQFLGESVPATRSALASLLPTVLGGVAHNALLNDRGVWNLVAEEIRKAQAQTPQGVDAPRASTVR